MKIGPITYTEVKVDDLRGDEGQLLFGQVKHLPRLIELNSSLTGIELLITRWHEAIHALEDMYGIVLSESDVSLLSTCIVQILIDNPDMCLT